MVSKNTNIALLLSALFCVGTLSVLVVFFYLGESHKVTFIEKSAQDIQEKARESALEKITSTLEETKDDRLSLSSRFPREENIVDVLASIERLGKEQGVEITTNTLTISPIDTVFETLVINVGIDGSYDAIIHVLKLLEVMPYQVRVANVHLERVGEGGGSSWRASGEIRITKFKKI